MSVTGWVVAIGVIVLLVLVAFLAFVVYTHLRARRLGLPTPTVQSYNPFSNNRYSSSYGVRPAPGGIVGWINDKVRLFKNRDNARTSVGGYEEPLNSFGGAGRSRRGFGPLDPDDAWDARVGNEADVYGPPDYDEEEETGYVGAVGDRGRARSRDDGGVDPYIGGSKNGLNKRYDEEMGAGPSRQGRNPFDDDAHASTSQGLRGISPRPMESGSISGAHSNQGVLNTSPTERRSMFTENV